MSGENTFYDITENPASAGAMSAITGRVPEFYNVSDQFPEDVPVPGFVGFQLDDRPATGTLQLWIVDSDYIDTDSGVQWDTDEDGSALEIITTGSPGVNQARLYASRGWVQMHSSRVGAYVGAFYDSYGTNFSIRNIRKLVADIAADISGLGDLSALNEDLTDTDAVAAINSAYALALAYADSLVPAARPTMLAIQRDSGDTDHDLEITEHYADGTSITITKQLDATFADGDNAGGMQSGDSLPTSGVVYIYRLTQDSNGSVDYIATDGSALVVPSGYTQASASYVIQWLTDSSANLVALAYDHMAGVMLHTGTLALDLSVTDQGTTRTTRTAANAPPNVVALCRYETLADNPGSGVIKIDASAHTDQAPTFSSAALGHSASARVQGEMLLRLDASRQYSTDASEANCDVYVVFPGWLWRPML